jgi:4-hydroxy-tetrahydrodipicolinate reductase
MGGMLLRLARADRRFELVAAVTRSDDPALGQDAGAVHGAAPLNLPVVAAYDGPCDVVVEFTLPDGCAAWADWCGRKRCALVSGTTGLATEHHQMLRNAAERAPVLWSPNMSHGANVLARLAGLAAELLPDADVEITEAHHSAKIDAPSGTARMLLESVCAARGLDPKEAAVHGRSGAAGPRPKGEIDVHALRMGDVVGDHEVHFAHAGESIALRHRAHARDAFAAGALHAALWLGGRPPGLYRMHDLLFDSQNPAAR